MDAQTRRILKLELALRVIRAIATRALWMGKEMEVIVKLTEWAERREK